MTFSLVLVATAFYAVFVLTLLWHWVKTPGIQKSTSLEGSFISIIIPVRDEAGSIENLIRSILAGSIKSGSYEILIIDDHSEDNTKEIAEQLMQDHDCLRIYSLPGGREGKKAAIAYGVERAEGELIVCTDGDSEVNQDWLACHASAYEAGAKLAFGPVRLFNRNQSITIALLNLELTGLVAMGAATLRMGRPTMINGCNYSFSKEAFEQVNGFVGNENIPTGDDEFLLRKIFNAYPEEVKFLKDEGATVTSEAPSDYSQFYHQRKRWASKWRFHREAFSALVPLFLFVCYLLWAICFLSAIVEKNESWIWVLGVKCLVDYVFLYGASWGQGRKFSLSGFILLQIIYPIYVVFFGVASNFGKYRWRKRVYNIQPNP